MNTFASAFFNKTAIIALVLNYFIARVSLWKCVLLWMLGGTSKCCWDMFLWPHVEPVCNYITQLTFRPP